MQLIRFVRMPLVLLLLLVTVGACRSRDRTAERLSADTAAANAITNDLTLANITLQQADNQGHTLWQVKAAQVTYSPDQKTAEVRSPHGELYQDGKPVFRVQAQHGTVEQNGEMIRLSGQITAVDLRSGAVLKGNELEWQPKQDTLLVQHNLTGTHPQVQFSATEARVYSRKRQMELSGQVIAVTRSPSLRLEAGHLIWLMEQQKILSDRPAKIQQVKGKQVTSEAQSNKATVDLKAKTVLLTQNGQLLLQTPPLQVKSNTLLWSLKDEIVNAMQPVTIVHRQQGVTVTADRGRLNLKQKMVYLNQNVQAVGERNHSRLNTDRLIWNADTQQINADGNVVYTQSNPITTVKAPRAVGRLQDRTIVLDGGRVETQIVPGQQIR